jgi:uncharacterized protein (DUF885 family)
MHKRIPFAAIARFGLGIVVTIALVGCGQDASDSEPGTQDSAPEAAARSIEAIADEYVDAMLEVSPTYATYLALPGARHDRLEDNSLEALADWQSLEDGWLVELTAIGDPTDVGSRDWVTYGILYEQLTASKGTRICRSELWQASTTTAWYTGLPFVFEIQPVDSDDLQQQALARLSEVAPYIDTEISNLRLGLELGYSAPRVTVAAVVEEVLTLTEDDSPFLSPAVRAENEAYTVAVRSMFEGEIVPAIKRFSAFIKNEYLPAAREEIALSYNPNGAECYPALVRSFATIQPTADEIHQKGLQQIAAIRRDMQVLIDEHFGGGSIEEFLRNLNIDPRFTFETKEDVLEYSVSALDGAKARMPEVFGRLPKADVLVKPYPTYKESGIGEYHRSSEDGERPGIFYIAVTDPTHRTKASQQATLFHETYPGHHTQIAIALELGDKVHPVARYLGNSGFSEGWALYSERLALELDLYSGPIDLFGMLSEQGARASRLVIDSGLHSKGWTRQQAVDYMSSNSAWPIVDIENDINRYISWPGQANSYMLGMLEITRLRALAEQKLGDNFDLSAFHDRIVGYGGSTLPMVDKSIRAWIEENR